MAVNPGDIYNLLDDKINPAIRRKTLQLVSGLNSDAVVPLLTNDDFAVLKRLLERLSKSEEKEEIESILRLFVNGTSSSLVISSKLLNDDQFLRKSAIFLENETLGLTLRKLSAMVLSNLTISEDGCGKFLKIADDLPRFVESLLLIIIKKLDVSVAEAVKERDELELRLYAAYILRNLTQSPGVRRILVTERPKDELKGETALPALSSLLPILTHSNDALKFAMAGILRNCCFDTDLHLPLIQLGNDDFLSALLFPLLGGEQFTDEENDALPIDLQYMDTDKKRESSAVVRVNLLEALYQLCATGPCREYLRSKSTYCVLREYHKWEQENLVEGETEAAQADVLCGNIIGVLIRTEEEMGCDNLRTLEETRLASN